MCFITYIMFLVARLTRSINPAYMDGLGKYYCGSTLKYGKEINATIATPLRVAFIYLRNQANFESSLDIWGITLLYLSKG